jgi:hypothetical protein
MRRLSPLTLVLVASLGACTSAPKGPPRSTWINKTGHWLTESRRIEIYQKSQRFKRLKEVLDQMNIDTLYVHAGDSPLAYQGYVTQGLFRFCHQLKNEGYQSWVTFHEPSLGKDPKATQRMEILVQRFARDNAKNQRCFKGIHLDLSDADATVANAAIMTNFLAKVQVPLSVHVAPAWMPAVSPFAVEITVESAPQIRLPASSPASTRAPVYRPTFVLKGPEAKKLKLKEIDGLAHRMELGRQDKGAAIASLETLMMSYDQESPPNSIEP